jgi:hypothetical protein
LKGERVAYKKDHEIEGKIKRDVLYEKFGEEKTNGILLRLGIQIEDLSDQTTFIEIYNFLEQDKKS